VARRLGLLTEGVPAEAAPGDIKGPQTVQ
jgi:hypothetical protein